MWFNVHFLMTNDVEYVFLHFLNTFLNERYIQIVHFKIGLFVFLLSVKSSLFWLQVPY